MHLETEAGRSCAAEHSAALSAEGGHCYASQAGEVTQTWLTRKDFEPDLSDMGLELVSEDR